ncbi:MAG: hypothetical protein DHS20C02_19090 [Micavibrio sp.]|nr:MAG: hypothetical protein DHS20C02_19090 [Micavibrio sp.]
MLLVMRDALFLICALALFATGFVLPAHAYVDGQDSELHIEFTQDIVEEADSDEADVFYNIPSFSVDNSRQLVLISKAPVSFFFYVQKRPPRI